MALFSCNSPNYPYRNDKLMNIDPKDPATYPVWTTDTIRYRDLDPNEHVNNGAINEYFEDGRVRFRQDYLSAAAYDILSGFALVRFTVEYHRPIFFPGEVEIGTAITRIGRTSYTLVQGLFRDGQCVASAEVISVLIDTKTGTPVPIPDKLRSLMEQVAPTQSEDRASGA